MVLSLDQEDFIIFKFKRTSDAVERGEIADNAEECDNRLQVCN